MSQDIKAFICSVQILLIATVLFANIDGILWISLRIAKRNVPSSFIFTGQPTTEIIRYAVHLCSPVLQIDNESNQVRLAPYEVSLIEIKKTALGKSLDESNILSIALSRVYLSLQRNKLMHSLLLPSAVIVASQYSLKQKIEYGKFLKYIDLHLLYLITNFGFVIMSRLLLNAVQSEMMAF